MDKTIFILPFIIPTILLFSLVTSEPKTTNQVQYNNRPMIVDNYDYREMYRARIMYDIMHGY